VSTTDASIEAMANTLVDAIAKESDKLDVATHNLAKVLIRTMEILGTCPHCVVRNVVVDMAPQVRVVIDDPDTEEEQRVELKTMLDAFVEDIPHTLH